MTGFEEEVAEMMSSALPTLPFVLAILRLIEDGAIWMLMEPRVSRRVVAWAAALVMTSTLRLVADQET